MKQIRVRINKVICTCLAAALAAAMLLSVPVFADETNPGSADWWRITNSENNNTVTDRRTPADRLEAWGKWEQAFEGGWDSSPTPPIIVNDYVYTVSGTKLYELNKETGEVNRVSDDLPGTTNYALQPALYADGRIFVAISNGRICAFNLDDLSLAWMTNSSGIVAGQTVSPLSYIKIDGTGYLYTGTRKNQEGEELNGGELLCVTTDDEDVREVGSMRIKSFQWHFHPKKTDAENLAKNGCEAEGYYNAGAYASEKFLAVGSDNGTLDGYNDANTAFYTLNPVTGAIIDSKYSIQGAVRSSVVYQNGFLYFASTKAILYKIAVDEEGHLGELSSIDLSKQGAASIATTPVVYGGRIYAGFCGPGDKYRADGGHGICVIQDTETLNDDSFVYKILTPGYPQGGVLLSTARAEEDYDSDGNPDGRVYLYCTLNTPPGAIFCTYDAPGQTEPAAMSMDEARIYIPSKPEHCISPLAVDADGTIYYKNDTGTLFAVEANPAALLSLTVFDEKNKELNLNQEFRAGTSQYEVTAATGAEKVFLQLAPAEGVNVSVNGAEYTAGTLLEIPLSESGETPVVIRTGKNGKTREYRVSVMKESANANLGSLASSVENAAPNESTMRKITPGFDPGITEYTIDWIGIETRTGLMNLFLKPENAKASVNVYAEENVKKSKVDSDGRVSSFDVPGSSEYSRRFAVYYDDAVRDTTVRVLVTAEDGATTKEYHVTFSRRVYVNDVILSQTEAEIAEGSSLTLSASVSPRNASDHSVVWSSTDESIVTVDQKGNVYAKGPGTAKIMATSPDGPDAGCEITVLPNHSIVPKEAAPATLETEGCARDCFVCEICGRFFEDEEGQTEIPKEEIVIPKLINISIASVSVPAQTYTGKALTPLPTVVIGKQTLKTDVDYSVTSYKNNKNAGTASLTITGKGKYGGSKTAAFTIKKAVKKTMTVKVKKKLFTVSTKKKTVLKAAQVFMVKKKVGTPVYKQLTKNPWITVAKNGKITVKKGLNKGKVYKIKVRVTDTSANYVGATWTVFVKIIGR